MTIPEERPARVKNVRPRWHRDCRPPRIGVRSRRAPYAARMLTKSDPERPTRRRGPAADRTANSSGRLDTGWSIRNGVLRYTAASEVIISDRSVRSVRSSPVPARYSEVVGRLDPLVGGDRYTGFLDRSSSPSPAVRSTRPNRRSRDRRPGPRNELEGRSVGDRSNRPRRRRAVGSGPTVVGPGSERSRFR